MREIAVRARLGSLGAVLGVAVLLGGSFASAHTREAGPVPGTPAVSDAEGASSVPESGAADEASSGAAPRADAGMESMGRRERPIARSVERAVDQVIRKHFSCSRADQGGVPCFPVTVERKWQYSVADSLEHLEFDDAPSPSRPPTVAEMAPYRPGPLSASGGIGVNVDALACKTKALFKKLGGRGRTYYLYRVWDATGERAVLRDRPFDATQLGIPPQLSYVALGSFTDECEAVAAWRRALRETRARLERGDGAAPRRASEDTPAGGHPPARADEGAVAPGPGPEDPQP